MRKFLSGIMITLFMVTTVYATPVEDVLEQVRIDYPKWNEKYVEGFFDCSEMSVYVSYKLTEAGIPNHIITGRATWVSYYIGHAFVQTDNPKVTIEATSLTIYENSYYAELYQFDDRTYRGGGDWDWWNSITNQQWYLHKLITSGTKGERIWAISERSKDYKTFEEASASFFNAKARN